MKIETKMFKFVWKKKIINFLQKLKHMIKNETKIIIPTDLHVDICFVYNQGLVSGWKWGGHLLKITRPCRSVWRKKLFVYFNCIVFKNVNYKMHNYSHPPLNNQWKIFICSPAIKLFIITRQLFCTFTVWYFMTDLRLRAWSLWGGKSSLPSP